MSITKVNNPILTGFNPDPSIIRVKDTFYLATSTFEYYPGVQIYKSTDLVNFSVVARPITESKLNLTGVPQGGGVWAPCLSHDGEKFYLVYSRVTSWSENNFKDCENYCISATDVEGEWSDPVYLNSDGFDASLFHDTDKSYYVCMEWDYRKAVGSDQFSGILLWEFDKKALQPIGEPKKIYLGTDRGFVEGPHIYKKDGWYYLFVAEGGTNVEHAESVARSRNIFGEYETHPNKHLITSYKTDNPLQKAGHASLVDDGKGNYYIAHLCGRKLFNGNCVLGRETALQNVEFREDGWVYLSHGGTQPRSYYTVNGDIKKEKRTHNTEFTPKSLSTVYQSLRTPLKDKVNIIDKNTIELTGGESICSLLGQNILVYRQQDLSFLAEVTLIDYKPEKFSQLSGLIYRYNEKNQYLLYVSFDETTKSKRLMIQSCVKGEFVLWDDYFDFDKDITLGVETSLTKGQFYYIKDGKKMLFGREFDTSVLSDETADPMGFTGAFVGMYAGDFSKRSKKARFTNFIYRPL